MVRRVVPFPSNMRNVNTGRMVPVEISLYDYVDDVGAKRRYEVTDVPPLRFRFPEAYFSFEENLRGGPQRAINLVADIRTFGPIDWTGKRKIDGRGSPIVHDLDLHITVSSNLVGRIDLPEAAERFPVERRDLFGHQDTMPAGRFGAFLVRRVVMPPEYEFRPDRSAMFGDVDLYAANYFVHPDPYGAERIKLIRCEDGAPTCQAYYIYKDREVSFAIPKRFMTDASRIGDGVYALITKHDIDHR